MEQPTMSDYFTICFEIKDQEQFDNDIPQLKKLFMKGYKPDLPYTIKGMSIHDEIRKVRLVEQLVSKRETNIYDWDIYYVYESLKELMSLHTKEELDKFEQEHFSKNEEE
jgi:hypothetical protein